MKRSSLNSAEKMATAPVFKLLLTMALPMMLSMMIQALYNIVDTVFIGMLPNRDAATQALGYAYPIQMLLVALGIGIGIGVNALLSRCLGEKNAEKAGAAAGNGYFLMLVFFLIFLAFGILVLTTGLYFNSCTQNEEVRELGKTYLGICLIFSFGQFLQLTAERCLCATGRTGLAMLMQISGALTNIVLDPVFIFAFDLGVAGAAIATVLGQCVSMGVGLFLNAKCNKELSIARRHFRPDKTILTEIFKVGLPAVVLQCLQSLTTLVFQLLFGFLYVGETKDLLVGIYGIYYKLQYFVLMLGYGLTNAVIPIVSFNYGGKQPERVRKTVLSALAMGLTISLLGLIVFEALPAPLLHLFNASETVTQASFSEFSIGLIIIRVTALSFPFALSNIVFASVFQALGQGMRAMIIALLRLLVVLAPACLLLGYFGGVNALWWGSIIAEAVALIYAALAYRNSKNKLLSR